jgi:AcrR family transcriptional regulator
MTDKQFQSEFSRDIMRHQLSQEALRTTILEAAERLIEQYGYKKTTMDDLARSAGIGKGTIYLYFHSKEDVALCVLDSVTERLHLQLQEIVCSNQSPSMLVQQFLVYRVMNRFDSIQRYAKSMDELFVTLRYELFKRRQKYQETEADILSLALDAGKNDGIFNIENIRDTAHSLLIATNGLLPSNLSPKDLDARSDIAFKLNNLVNLLIRGLLTQGHPPVGETAAISGIFDSKLSNSI